MKKSRQSIAHQPRKRFAQHFLERPWAERLLAALDPQPTDTFVEIGPGRGALTIALAGRIRRLLAIEIDRDLAAGLSAMAPSHVTIVEGDILQQDLPALLAAHDVLTSGSRLRVVGNLPYNISSPVLFLLLRAASARGLKPTRYEQSEDAGRGLKPTRYEQSEDAGRGLTPTRYGHKEVALTDATLMLQREVADRLVASPGSREYGRLTVLTALGADVSRLFNLPPGAFRPAPAVQSTVVRLTFRPSPVAIADVAAFDALIREMFSHRRKTLTNALKAVASARGLAAADIVRVAGIDGTRRPETLDLAELSRLDAAFRSAHP